MLLILYRGYRFFIITHTKLVNKTDRRRLHKIDILYTLLHGISDYNINRLQRIQNSVACIVTHTRKYDHITPILQKLHWLPVRECIHFKILLITYKSINDMAPDYLCELISIRKSSRKLKSSSQILLQVPVSRLKSYGDCAFSVVAPHFVEQVAGRYQKCVISRKF